jgi:phosphatidate cytidylyltransferase
MEGLMSKLLKRTITVLIMAPIFMVIVTFDVPPYQTLPFLILVIGLTILASLELYAMAKIKDPVAQVGVFFSAFVVLLAFFVELQPIWNSYIALGFSIFLIIVRLMELSRRKLYFSGNTVMTAARGVLYFGWSLAFFVLIRNLPSGKWMVVSIILVIWALDIAAFFTGSLIGKHKLNPEISPKKTIEGAIGGTIVAVGVSYLLLTQFVGPVHSLILGSLLAIFGQSGDLYESLLKRTYKVKDSSDIIPGHGGIMDRLDSFLLVAPIAYYYLIIFMVRI